MCKRCPTCFWGFPIWRFLDRWALLFYVRMYIVFTVAVALEVYQYILVVWMVHIVILAFLLFILLMFIVVCLFSSRLPILGDNDFCVSLLAVWSIFSHWYWCNDSVSTTAGNCEIVISFYSKSRENSSINWWITRYFITALKSWNGNLEWQKSSSGNWIFWTETRISCSKTTERE